MSVDQFFEERREQSGVKSLIVAEYFEVWAKIILKAMKKSKPSHEHRIVYLDLFCGPGSYEDGSPSTPLMIIERAADDPEIRSCLVAIFNDRDREIKSKLEETIANLPAAGNLKYRPKISNREVGDGLVDEISKRDAMPPTLCFVDPFGYKGVSLKLVQSILKAWGSECIFFFNYNRINMALDNPLVHERMTDLFGSERAQQLEKVIEGMDPQTRERTILMELTLALQETGGKYVTPFRFAGPDGKRTSHYIIHVTTHVRGHEKMKEVMARHSSSQSQGISALRYSSQDEKEKRQGTLFELTTHLEDLAEKILGEFSGKVLTMTQIYEMHHPGKRYVKENYKGALKRLEEEGKIQVDPPMKDRRPNTFGDNVKVVFPPKGN